MIKTIKITLLLLLGMLTVFTITACEKDIDEPEEPGIVEPTPEPEPEPEPEPDVLEDKTVHFDATDLVQGVFKNVGVNVKGYSYIVIKVIPKDLNSKYDVPVNINYFKLDGVPVEFTGIEGTSYRYEHEFNIGELKATGNTINTINNKGTTDLRLHTVHNSEIKDNYLKIELDGLNELEFSFTVTTASYKYIESLEINLVK